MIKIQIEEYFTWMDAMSFDEAQISSVAFYMNDFKKQFPDKRIRAINSRGAVIDLLI